MQSLQSQLLRVFAVLTVLLFTQSASAQLQKVVTLLKGEVENTEGKKLSDVSVSIFKGTEKINTTKTNSEGKFVATLQPDATYRVTFTNSNYLFMEQTLTIPKLEKFQETPLRVTMAPLRNGDAFTIAHMVFKPGSSMIESAASSRLEEIAKLAKQNPKLTLHITVYPDATIKSAKQSADEKLLSSRASAVTSLLMSKGLTEKNFVIEQVRTVPTGGKFAVEVVEKKKKKEVKKTVMVPQYIQVVAKVG